MKNISTGRYLRVLSLLLLFFVLFPADGLSQYFGRNRPSYQRFDFKMHQTPHFDIYHYFENDSVIKALANTYEKWYTRHQKIFRDTFETQNPIIMYANHPDFQQTTAVGGMIGIGTMGVTEALRNRVVMPILETNAQTDHVIGHELVHVFQFRQMFLKDSLALNSIGNLPLWLVEGMAEYFSLGSVDTHTAMIMRDAVYQDDLPSLRDMTRDYSYNPYRYGHSFVSFVGRTWGDSLIAPLFSETAKFGYERALERVVGLGHRTAGNMWHSALRTHYEPFMQDTARHQPVGERLLSSDNSGSINISPAVSPDGSLVAFFSERDLISIDLFLADAQTGDIKRKLASATRSGDIDGYNFFESRGAWSPDGRKFVHVAVKQGKNQLVIVDVNRPRRTREIEVPGVPALNNPAWSPDGKHLVFNGLVDGQPDLFRFNLETKEVTRLTNDRYSYVHASFSEDGRTLIFSTDRPQTAQIGDKLNMKMNIGMMDLDNPNGSITVLDIFPGADNLNPLFSPEDKSIYFLTNADGFRNLHEYDIETGKVFRLTDYFTGISGITHMTPAVSLSRETGELFYSHYKEGDYSVFRADPSEFDYVEVDPMHIDMTASILPPAEAAVPSIVDNKLGIEPIEPILPEEALAEKPYDGRFSLTFIGSSGVGVATSRFGTGMAGGVSMMFSDILGDHQLFTTLAVNGEIYDFGGMVGYLNQRSRINWGASISHIPFSFARLREEIIPVNANTENEDYIYNLQFIQQRTFQDELSLFAFYPISTTRRIEAGGSVALYYFRMDAFNNYFYRGMPIAPDEGAGRPYRERLTDLEPGSFMLQRLNLAYVGDNSFFGMASPIAGYRYRLGGERMFGEINMYSVTADYRHYFRFRPLTLALRGIHYGRYGPEAENDLFFPLYLGYPGYVRGYDYSSLRQLESTFDDAFMLEQLQGTRVLLGGIEARVPFTGPEQLALISSNFFFTELSWFLDAGVAWTEDTSITLDRSKGNEPGKRYPIFSTGPSLRINLFGALILEPYFALPFHTRGIQEGVWGLNFLPGW